MFFELKNNLNFLIFANRFKCGFYECVEHVELNLIVLDW